MITRGLIATLTLAAGALAACGGSTPTSTSTPARASSSPGAATATPSGPSTIATGSTSLGTVLTNAQGLTLYYFVPEKGSVVACTGGCASTWPPLKAGGTTTKPPDVPGTLGTVTLADGSTQVTYNGWPLHTYAADSAPGQTNGQGIAGKWFAATPALTANGAAASAATPTPSSNPYGY